MQAGPLLSLLRWVSPTLPIGAYAYSRGLEQAVERGWVSDEASALAWIRGILEHGVVRLDAPVLVRVLHALATHDHAQVAHWNDYLCASRESLELSLEDTQMGAAFMRILRADQADHQLHALLSPELQSGVPDRFRGQPSPVSYVAAFALACARSGVDSRSAVTGFLWACAESQTGAAMRLIPLGQSAGQRILSALSDDINAAVPVAHALRDEELGNSLPALALASAFHETQYTRLFRS